MGFGGCSAAVACDNDLVTVGDALLPCGDDLVRLGDMRVRLGFHLGIYKDEPSLWNRVPGAGNDGSSSLRTSFRACGDGSSSLIGKFVPLAHDGASFQCQHDCPEKWVLQVLPSSFIAYSLKVTLRVSL